MYQLSATLCAVSRGLLGEENNVLDRRRDLESWRSHQRVEGKGGRGEGSEVEFTQRICQGGSYRLSFVSQSLGGECGEADQWLGVKLDAGVEVTDKWQMCVCLREPDQPNYTVQAEELHCLLSRRREWRRRELLLDEAECFLGKSKKVGGISS